MIEALKASLSIPTEKENIQRFKPRNLDLRLSYSVINELCVQA